MELNPAKVSFGRHESFPLRFGWITKGLDALAEDANVFTAADATVTLGVGKNMVAAMRYWLLATRMVEQTDTGFARSAIGEILFPDGEGGDRYLEDDGTIWLLHWLLATNPTKATAIYWFYNHFHKPEVASEEVFAGLREFVRQQVTAKTAPTTLRRDANLMLRMYAQSSGGTRLLAEDALDSPLAALLLLERLDRQTWQAVPRDREEIPLVAFAYAVADVFAHLSEGQLPVERLMYSGRGHCAPGAVFRLTEGGLTAKLEALCEEFPESLRLDRTAGLYQLYKIGPFEPLPILQAHYQAPRGKSGKAKGKRRRVVETARQGRRPNELPLAAGGAA